MGDLGHSLGTFIVGIVIIAGIFVMVRPQSQGPTLVDAFGNSMTNLVTAATGGGTW